MAEFYHEVLWQGVGELSEPYLLWNNSVPLDLASSPPTATDNNFDYSRKEYLPFGMQHPRLSLGLCGLVQETLAAPIGGNSPDLLARFVIQHTTLQSIMNAKLSQHRFWDCHENGLIKTIQTIPHNLYVSFKLTSLYCGLRIILVYPNPQ